MAEETKPFTMAINYDGGKEGWPFPVLPNKVTIKRDGSGKDYRIVGGGPITTIEKPELAEISFEGFFPSQNYPFNGDIFRSYRLPNGLPNAHKFVTDINRWMHSGHPVRFTYVGSNTTNDETKIWLPMTITSFERWEEGGSPGDIFYSLKLKEYVFYAPRKIKSVQQADGSTKLLTDPPARWDPRVPPTTYTLQPGDTLSKVSLKIYGDTNRWRDIMELNGITMAETKRLQVGRVLRLPPKK